MEREEREEWEGKGGQFEETIKPFVGSLGMKLRELVLAEEERRV